MIRNPRRCVDFNLNIPIRCTRRDALLVVSGVPNGFFHMMLRANKSGLEFKFFECEIEVKC